MSANESVRITNGSRIWTSYWTSWPMCSCSRYWSVAIRPHSGSLSTVLLAVLLTNLFSISPNSSKLDSKSKMIHLDKFPNYRAPFLVEDYRRSESENRWLFREVQISHWNCIEIATTIAIEVRESERRAASFPKQVLSELRLHKVSLRFLDAQKVFWPKPSLNQIRNYL